MSIDHERQQAHSYLDQLPPARLRAVRTLLESMLVPTPAFEDEEISEEEEAAVARSKQWFHHNEGIPFEQVVAELGFTMEQIRSRPPENPENRES